MANVTMDLIDGANAVEHLSQGQSITVMAVVTGLGDEDGDTPSRLQAAIDAVKDATGPLGSPCPVLTLPTYLEQIAPDAITDQQIKVRCIYRGFPAVEVEIDSTLGQTQSNTDIDGNLVSVQYTYPTNYHDLSRAGRTVPQGGLYPRPIPEMLLTFKWVWADTDYTTVAAWCRAYIGMVNANVVDWAGSDDSVRTWLIEKVSGKSRDGGNNFDMTITYHYRKTGWDQYAVYISPDDGKPPPDLVENVGYKRVQIYEEGIFPSPPL